MKLFSLLHAFFNPAFITRTYLTLWGGGDGGGDGGGSQTSTSYSTNLPEYAQPYYQELLKQTGREVFSTDSKGNVTGMKPGTALPTQTVAGFNPLQRQVQQNVAGMQRPGEFGQSAQGLAGGQQLGYNTAMQGLNQAFSYRPENISAMGVYNPELEQFQMQQPRNVSAQNIASRNISNQNINALPRINANTIQAATTNYRPELRQFGMGPAERVSTGTATGNELQPYMSPYQSAVTDTAVREAKLQGDLAKQQGALGAIGRGTFGGARQALMQTEQERGLNQQISDIRYKGAQDAYTQAQAQFNADQARKMQAATANQQAGLTTGQANLQSQLQTQQLGTQTGIQAVLANLTNQQQANVQSEANRLQAQGMTADNAIRTALANQQSNLQAQQANQQSYLQAQQANQQYGLQAQLANQQAGLTTGQQNLQALLGIQQLGAGQSLEAQKANQAAALQAAQMNQQGRQFGATLGSQLGLAGLQGGIDTSKALGALGTERQQADLARLTAQGATGAQQQELAQRQADIAYQNRMAQLNYPRQSLQFYSDLLRGNAGALGSTQVQYTPQPSATSQIAGLGLAGLGLAKALG